MIRALVFLLSDSIKNGGITSQLHQELHIYKIYLKKFPTISELIMRVVKKKEAEIQCLKSELNVLRSLIEAY